ncbi:MAG: L-seryl-tRNA(Sec) selenium transferase [Firmicutes bacterium]|nr:L-seryl-tRNA(Sec) selenium transferase [Bacillota bacterium]
MNELLRALPRVDDVLDRITNKEDKKIPRAVLIDSIREILDNCRKDIINGKHDDVSLYGMSKISEMAIALAKSKLTPKLRPVINATGIVLHTNLGRAPLAEYVAEHVKRVAMGYSALEYDLETGKRGSRTHGVENLLSKLTNAEAACIVNNNAAAVLLTLSALCAGAEVAVSRGELVEIGGSFRVPEVISQGGAILREVGATNKTHLSDYRRAISTGKKFLPVELECSPVNFAILKVHTSNYKIMGFAHEVPTKDLADLAKEMGVLSIYDLGSGSFVSFAGEPTVQQAVADGMDIVCFSGDKLLGGSQCGIILGSGENITKIRKHPLYRALRADKLTLAALEATLGLYLDFDNVKAKIPTLAMLLASSEELLEKSARLLKLVSAIIPQAVLQGVNGQAGGGSLPMQEFESWAVAIPQSPGLSVEKLEEHMRGWRMPIVARIHKDTLLLDVRTIEEHHFTEIAECLRQVSSGL